MHLDWGSTHTASTQVSWSEGFSPIHVQADRSGMFFSLGTGVLAPVWDESC